MESGAKIIRVSYSDPDITDPSSDEREEQLDETHKRSNKKVHEIDLISRVESLEKKKTSSGTRVRSEKLDSSGEKIVGVRLRKSGEYCAEITDPILQKGVHVGTFYTREEAWEAYKAMKREIQEKVMRVKQGVQDSPIETLESSNEVSVENEVPEKRFGYLFGVQIVDENGFLLGEFSKIDDLRIPSTEDGIICQATI